MIESYGVHSNRQAWLGIDPGVTTGWALLDDAGEQLGTGNVEEHELRRVLDTLIRVAHNDGYRLNVVVERVPRVGGLGSLARRLDFVTATVAEVVHEVYELPNFYVTPGEWKPSRVARTTKLKRGLSPHQRDAIRMTLYVIDKEKRRAD